MGVCDTIPCVVLEESVIGGLTSGGETGCEPGTCYLRSIRDLSFHPCNLKEVRAWSRCFVFFCLRNSAKQVLRRATYKGQLSSETALPVDACTVMGIVITVGSLLAAPGLPQQTLDGCCKVLGSMEDHATLPDTIALLPGVNDFLLDVKDNTVELKALKSVMSKLEIPWARHSSFAKQMFVA